MKKTSRRSADRDTMRPHYDFRGGVRGKYASKYRAGTNVVVLDPDAAAAFPNAAAVRSARCSMSYHLAERSGVAPCILVPSSVGTVSHETDGGGR